MFDRLLGKTKTHVGLDIGSGAVKMIQAQRNGESFSVIAAGIAEIDQQKITDLGYKAAASEAVNACLELARCQPGEKPLAVSSISGPEVIVRSFDFPPIPSEDIKSAVELEASQVCPVDIKQCALDYQILQGDPETEYQFDTQNQTSQQVAATETNNSSDGTNNASAENNRIKGILVAAPKTLLESRISLFNSIGTHCCMLDVNPLAALNCFDISINQSQKNINNEKNINSVALLDIGKNTTNFVMIDEQKIPFVRDFSYGSKQIISKLAEIAELPSQQIVDFLIASPDDVGIPEYTQKLAAAAKRLITDINETIRYCSTRNSAPPVKTIYLFGAFARAPQFSEILDSKLPVNVAVWNPFENIPCDADENTKKLLETNGPAFAVAAGLAARSF